jgi:hypothetical protein
MAYPGPSRRPDNKLKRANCLNAFGGRKFRPIIQTVRSTLTLSIRCIKPEVVQEPSSRFAFIYHPLENRTEDDFHSQAHFAARNNDRIVSGHEGFMKHSQ